MSIRDILAPEILQPRQKREGETLLPQEVHDWHADRMSAAAQRARRYARHCAEELERTDRARPATLSVRDVEQLTATHARRPGVREFRAIRQAYAEVWAPRPDGSCLPLGMAETNWGA